MTTYEGMILMSVEELQEIATNVITAQKVYEKRLSLPFLTEGEKILANNVKNASDALFSKIILVIAIHQQNQEWCQDEDEDEDEGDSAFTHETLEKEGR